MPKQSAKKRELQQAKKQKTALAIRTLQTLADLIRDQHGDGDVQIRIERTDKKEMEQ